MCAESATQNTYNNKLFGSPAQSAKKIGKGLKKSPYWVSKVRAEKNLTVFSVLYRAKGTAYCTKNALNKKSTFN